MDVLEQKYEARKANTVGELAEQSREAQDRIKDMQLAVESIKKFYDELGCEVL